MIILTQWPDSIISYKRSVQGITKECCFILPTFAGSRHERGQKRFTHVQLLSCKYFNGTHDLHKQHEIKCNTT